MKNYSNRRLAIAAIALAMPVATLYAQGGRNVAALKNNPAPTSPVSGNAAAGKPIYYSYGCYACHGYNGETGARAFVGNWGNLSTEQAFISFLRGRANVAPITPSTSMPNFGENSLSDKQAKDLYAYIRTFKSTAGRSEGCRRALNAILEAAKQDRK